MVSSVFKTIADTFTASTKRKASDTDGMATPTQSSKKSKKLTESNLRQSSIALSEAMVFEANVVSHTYKPKNNEVAKEFDEIMDGYSLVYQARDFFKGSTKVVFKNGHNWDALNRYRTAVYMETSFAVGDDVLVKQFETDDDTAPMAQELKGRWVGRMLEIRAIDQENVYLLINWFQRPEDLPRGRQSYHGLNEIVATNDVDIVAPSTLDGKIDVQYWIESDNTNPPEGTVFWRQCAAVEDKKGYKFSKLRTLCVCKQPENVDKLLLKCEKCDIWLHDECLVKDLAKKNDVKKWERIVLQEEDGSLPEILPNRFKMMPTKGKSWNVNINEEQALFQSGDKGADPWRSKIECLKCGSWIG